jgi:hypothetical protein
MRTSKALKTVKPTQTTKPKPTKPTNTINMQTLPANIARLEAQKEDMEAKGEAVLAAKVGDTIKALNKRMETATEASEVGPSLGKRKAEQEQEDAKPVVKLPVVKSYDLDLPKDEKARAQFDREVDAMYRRISGSWRK